MLETSGAFEILERARGRGGDGGILSVFGFIPAIVSYVSENYANDLSEIIYNTSARTGWWLDVRRELVVWKFKEYDASREFSRQYWKYNNPIPRDVTNIYGEARETIKLLEFLYKDMIISGITDEKIERQEDVFMEYRELDDALKSRGYPVELHPN